MQEKIERVAVFDTETTGVDVENDMIVTAFLGVMEADGTLKKRHSWVIDRGIEIPEGAAKVHGWTTERVREHGDKDWQGALLDIAMWLEFYSHEMPVVIYNAPYDITLLDREIRRLDTAPLRLPEVIIDPLVIDKRLDKWRKGSRKLADVAARYGVPVGDAHDAEADCIMAGKLALLLLGHSAFKGMALHEIHARTVDLYREQATSLRDYFIKNGRQDDARTVRLDWPIVPWGTGQAGRAS